MTRRTLTKEEYQTLLDAVGDGAPREVLMCKYVADGFHFLPRIPVMMNPSTWKRMRFTLELIAEHNLEKAL